jgi:hypothetical protein
LYIDMKNLSTQMKEVPRLSVISIYKQILQKAIGNLGRIFFEANKIAINSRGTANSILVFF